MSWTDILLSAGAVIVWLLLVGKVLPKFGIGT